MVGNLISFSIRNKMIIGIFTFGLIVWGSYSITQLPIDAVPDITNNQVQVYTIAPTLAAQETERFITAPLEMAMSTLPDVIELRSISRFGLSVITVVFKDEVNIFLARQLVGERIKEAENEIPAGIGTPELAPISSGLGEIYQYILSTKPGYENKYSAMDLRTIQEWIVRRQLSGTPGLAEVSAWGGFVKQYEIAVSPDKLNSMKITFLEIFEALKNNNESTGGAYIEKQNNAYFIRGLGLINSLDDIKKIVVKTVHGAPVFVRDIAEVNYGNAIRYGAVTKDGRGEVVAGIALMLKGENSGEVIKNVKGKITQIQKSLPEGVQIVPFMERSSLVNKAIGTVEKNLLEGGLIVVFVLVLLLGNLRAGLIVASVIPLSMLFAISMMNLFGISGNLMSLGAIDFGLIVDGAVIIVESVIYQLTIRNRQYNDIKILSAGQMDHEVLQITGKMMNSASFGQIIILIVYIPILTLVGIEGKMFRPMAQTVSFAIIGALLLSLTYIPMMSALFLSRKTEHRQNISGRIMEFIQGIYKPVIEFSMRKRTLVIGLSAILFISSLFVFRQLGGEFIPTLEEGDLAVETFLMQGSSLSQSIATCTMVEKILIKEFPEVLHVVSRIGSAEIPTDPMPLETACLIVAMKDKKEWVSAGTRIEMMEKMETALSVIPGVRFEITQPIQMRFNELMTGIRQDVAVKIYGDDISILAEKAEEVSRIISSVRGIERPLTEKVAGLPQINVEYNRDKIAQYGTTIANVNKVLKTAFAGETAGVIFEGERKFDMVVRLKIENRSDIEDVKSLFVPLPSGSQVPISQLADISFKEGPAQISRDDSRRRIFVGFNVRGRDVESVVNEIQQKLDGELRLPPGYYITYGGQFQNLVEARQRLSLALPAALLLIFILLFLAFKSFKQSMLIYTAIPLSCIGGILALWLRDMPFSISAGVGFIALFGVAVLNGIVLIAHFNQLKKEGITNIFERVRIGTRERLRPVIMTASVASLGFLPMAVSSSAGAEVQKPLATVVIGGLISATLLTLIILPVLYILFSGGVDKKPGTAMTLIPVILFSCLIFGSHGTHAQADPESPLTLDDAMGIALKNNPQTRGASLELEQQQILKKTTLDLPKTGFSFMNGQYNSEVNDRYYGVSQEFYFPAVYVQQNRVQNQNISLSALKLTVTQDELLRNVKSVFYELSYILEKLKILNYQDSIFKDFVSVAEVKYKTGETSFLEKLSAQSMYQEVQLMKKKTETDLQIRVQELRNLLNIQDSISIAGIVPVALLLMIDPDTLNISHNSLLNYYNRRIDLTNSQYSLEKSKWFPDISIGYFNQSLDKIRGFQGYQVGIALPVFFWPQQGRIQAGKIQTLIAQNDYENYHNNLRSEINKHLLDYQNNRQFLEYYEHTGLIQVEEILKVSQLAYGKGEIGYLEYIQSLNRAIGIRFQYLDYRNRNNQLVINIMYLTGGK